MSGRPITNLNAGGTAAAAVKQLKAVGFTPREIRFLLEGDITTERPERYVITERKLTTLRTALTEGTTLGKLIVGGFTRPQAKVLIRLGIV